MRVLLKRFKSYTAQHPCELIFRLRSIAEIAPRCLPASSARCFSLRIRKRVFFSKDAFISTQKPRYTRFHAPNVRIVAARRFYDRRVVRISYQQLDRRKSSRRFRSPRDFNLLCPKSISSVEYAPAYRELLEERGGRCTRGEKPPEI